VEVAVVDRLERRVRGRERGHLHPLTGEGHLEELARVALVVDDEHFGLLHRFLAGVRIERRRSSLQQRSCHRPYAAAGRIYAGFLAALALFWGNPPRPARRCHRRGKTRRLDVAVLLWQRLEPLPRV